MHRLLLAALLILCGTSFAAPFQPDPNAVQRLGPAYRYPQNGWIVVHIEGDPYERGVQHGRLLAPEIAAYVRCLAASYGYKAPNESWNLIRQLTGALMLPKYPTEQLEEMQGIADGASAAGARVDGRFLDVTDIAAINAANELDLLPDALKATPNGLDIFPQPTKTREPSLPGARPERRPHPTRCSAFAAVGPATKDGKIVFGHITMYDLYPANFYNVWLDIKPTKGLHFSMQTAPGGIHSGMDYTLNSAGILMSETTIQQTGCDFSGIPLASRIRTAAQYADSIEKAAEILSTSSNGMCSTEWILADVHRNEIALLSLGLRHHKLHRSSREEWIDGAEGFYWSCNNAKDAEVRLETTPSLKGRPSPAAVFEPSKRDALWMSLYSKHKGHIDENFARTVLTTPALVAAFSADAKYTTSDMASKFQSWATFGPPVGVVRSPSVTERSRFPEIHPLVSNPWTVLECAPPPAAPGPAHVSDLHDPENPLAGELPTPTAKKQEPETLPAWHGTLLPASDADLWLPVAFANYERIVALEKRLKSKSPSPQATTDFMEEVGVEVSYYRSLFELGARAGADTPLAQIQATPRNENWYRIACGKGVLLLNSLRGLLGEETFDTAMESFGQAFAGKQASTSAFRAHMEKAAGRSLEGFFSAWTQRPGLPRIQLVKAETRRAAKGWSTSVTLARGKDGPPLSVPVILEFESNKESAFRVPLETPQATGEILTLEKPTRVSVDKFAISAASNGQPFTILSFDTELDESIIVYGTLTESAANEEAAHALQLALRRREHNIAVPIKADTDLTDAELKNAHLLCIGRPDSNRIVQRFSRQLPVRFGSQSFEVRDEIYAHPESAVVAAVENPLNPRYSLVTVAGLSSHGTLKLMPSFEEESLPYAQVVVVPHGRESIDFSVRPEDLAKDLR